MNNSNNADIHMLHIGADTRTSLLGTGTLELRDIQETDAAWYSCVAVDYSGQNVTAQAYLTVLGKKGASIQCL